MDINFMEYFNVLIVLACLLIGFIIKKWIKDVDNKWIPTIVFVIGVCAQFYVAGISIESFVIGGISGIASTGFYEMFNNFITRTEG